MFPMIVAVNIAGPLVGTGLGRASAIAVAEVDQGQINSWEEFEVRWDLSHDQIGAPVADGSNQRPASHGSHHARIVTFMKDHQIELVVTGHIGPPLAHTLGLMGITTVVDASGDARQAAILAAGLIAEQGSTK